MFHNNIYVCYYYEIIITNLFLVNDLFVTNLAFIFQGYEAKGTDISNRYTAMQNYEKSQENRNRRKRSTVLENQPYTQRQAQCILPVPSLKNHVDELMIFYKAQDGGIGIKIYY